MPVHGAAQTLEQNVMEMMQVILVLKTTMENRGEERVMELALRVLEIV